MTLKEQFERALIESKELSSRPDNSTLLNIYSLYKQATEGDAPEEGPSNPFDFVGVAKHEAWLKMKGTSADAAMQQYVELVERLKKG